MPEQAKDRRPPIDLSEVAWADQPEAPSLAEEQAERERQRRSENETAAGEKPLPLVAPPPD